MFVGIGARGALPGHGTSFARVIRPGSFAPVIRPLGLSTLVIQPGYTAWPQLGTRSDTGIAETREADDGGGLPGPPAWLGEQDQLTRPTLGVLTARLRDPVG